MEIGRIFSSRATQDAIEVYRSNISQERADNFIPRYVAHDTTNIAGQPCPVMRTGLDFSSTGPVRKTANNLDLIWSNKLIATAINPITEKQILYPNGMRFELALAPNGTDYYLRSVSDPSFILQGAKIEVGNKNADGPLTPIAIPMIYKAQPSTTMSFGGIIGYNTHLAVYGMSTNIELPNTRNSQNYNINVGELLLPESLGNASLALGSTFKVDSDDQELVLEYGGIIHTMAVSTNHMMYQARSAVEKFTPSDQLKNGHAIGVKVNNRLIRSFTFHTEANPALGQFSSLAGLANLLAKQPELLVRLHSPHSAKESSVLYIGAKDTRDAISFADIGGSITHGLGLNNNNIESPPAKVVRFNSLLGLNQAINKQGGSSLMSALINNQDQVIAAGGGLQGVHRLRVTASDTKALNIDTRVDNAWFTSGQASISKDKPNLMVVVPEFRHGSITAGDTIQIQDYDTIIQRQDGSKIDLNNKRLKVLEVDAANATIILSIEGIAAPDNFKDNEVVLAATKPFKLRKVAGASLTENIKAQNIKGGPNSITFTTQAGHTIQKDDKIYIPNLKKILQGYGDEVSKLASQIHEVISADDQSFAIAIAADLQALVTVNTNLGAVQKISESPIVMRSYSDQEEDRGLIKVYQGGAIQCNIGDKIAFRNTADEAILVDGTDRGNVVIRDELYDIKNYGRDELGEFVVIAGMNGGNNGTPDNYITYAAAGMGADAYVENYLTLAAYLGLDPNKLGTEGYSPAMSGYAGTSYDENGITAPNLTRNSFEPNPDLKKQMQLRTSVAMGVIIDDLGGEHNYKLSMMPLDQNMVQVEVAIIRDVNGKYNCQGMDEASDGIIASGQLHYTRGKLANVSGSIANHIALNWLKGNKVISSNMLKLDFTQSQLLNDAQSTVGQNITDHTGVKTNILGSADDLIIEVNGNVRVKRSDGNMTEPLYRLKLYQVLNPSQLQAASGTAGYKLSAKSGPLTSVDKIAIFSNSVRDSGVDSAEQYQHINELLNHDGWNLKLRQLILEHKKEVQHILS